MRCYRKILHISYKDHVTDKEVRAGIQQAIGPHEDLTVVKRCKLQWYGHVFRSSDLVKTILQGIVKGGRRQDQRMDRPGFRQVPGGSGKQGKLEKTGCEVICGSPTTLAVKGLMMVMMMYLCCCIIDKIIMATLCSWATQDSY